MDQSQVILQYRPVLCSIAYKMTGCFAVAEDIVHDTFLKWLRIDLSTIKNIKAYLVRAVTQNCINYLKSAQNRLTEFWDPDKADEIKEENTASFHDQSELNHEMKAALAHIDQQLPPLEKAIYLLREGFDFEYEDLQELFEKKKEHCRQLFSRATKKLRQASLKKPNIQMPKSRFLENFKAASQKGQLSELIQNLLKDIGTPKK